MSRSHLGRRPRLQRLLIIIILLLCAACRAETQPDRQVMPIDDVRREEASAPTLIVTVQPDAEPKPIKTVKPTPTLVPGRRPLTSAEVQRLADEGGFVPLAVHHSADRTTLVYEREGERGREMVTAEAVIDHGQPALISEGSGMGPEQAVELSGLAEPFRLIVVINDLRLAEQVAEVAVTFHSDSQRWPRGAGRAIILGDLPTLHWHRVSLLDDQGGILYTQEGLTCVDGTDDCL